MCFGLESAAAAHNKLGVVSDTSIPLPRLKTVRNKVTECVSSDTEACCFDVDLHMISLFLTSCMTHEPARPYCTKR